MTRKVIPIFPGWGVCTIILTIGNFLLRKKTSVHIHGKVHHVCVTEKIQFTIEQLLFIINLKHNNQNIFPFSQIDILPNLQKTED